MKTRYGVLLSLFMAAITLTSTARAQDLVLGEPGYGGTGCPAGSASAVLSPDQKTISILFDQYVVEAGGNKLLDRKNCNIAIPVKVPQGFSVAVFAIDYRGFIGLPSGASAQLNVEYFIAGNGRGLRTSKFFSGPSTSDYLKTDSLEMESVVWSECGANTNLRANTTLRVQSNRLGQQAMATVDSADVRAGLVYHLQWRRCGR